MKKECFLILVFVAALFNFAHAYDDGDFQVWNTDVEEFKVNKDLKVAFEEEFRWADNANEFCYHHYDWGLFYSWNKYLNLGAGYRQIYELKSGEFKPENDPYLTATLFLDVWGVAFDSRSRLEYRHFDYQDDSWRYRNKFTLKFPWKFTKIQIQPYISDEIFIGFGNSVNEFNQNRFSSGLGLNLTKNLKAEIYYMLVSAKSSGIWKDANVLGVKLKASF
jgi:hypothetical protein